MFIEDTPNSASVADGWEANIICCTGCRLLSVISPQSNCSRNVIPQTADTMAVFDCSTCHTHTVMLCAIHYFFNLHFARHMLPKPLISARQHYVMVTVWRLRGNIIRTALCWILWHNVHSQQHTCMSSSYRSNRLSLSHWDPYTVRRGSGSGGIQAWSPWSTGFPQCFETVGLYLACKIVPEMTYNVFSGTLSLYTTTTTTTTTTVMLLIFKM